MVSTRSSQESRSPPSKNKRSGEKLSSPPTKRSKNSSGKSQGGQQTIEQTLENTKREEDEVEHELEKEANDEGDGKDSSKVEELKRKEAELEKREKNLAEKEKQQNGSATVGASDGKDEEKPEPQQNGHKASKKESNGEKNAFDEVKGDVDEVKQAAKEGQDSKTKDIKKNNKSVIDDKDRNAQVPSSVLEKGIIYFFFRGRVGIDDPHGLEDIARSYIVLRPLPVGAKLGEGPLEDAGNARLVALPKKMLPKSGRDRFLSFVEKAGSTIKDLRDQFQGTEYATKTSGTSQVPAATPFAEGVYAITSTGASSHLAYHITVPASIGEVQKELGLNEKGSYIISLKNPEAPSPPSARIGNPAKYTKEIQDQFRGRRWMPVTPETLDFEGSQFLLIGEGQGTLEKASNVDGDEHPEEEIEKLEEEDNDRVESLKEDDPVFADLGLSSKQYPHLQTTW